MNDPIPVSVDVMMTTVATVIVLYIGRFLSRPVSKDFPYPREDSNA